MKRYLAGFLVIIVAAAATFLYFDHSPRLIDFQKRYLFAGNEKERNEVIDQLEKYYLGLSIPDSIRRQVDGVVAEMVDTTRIRMDEYDFSTARNTSAYDLESRLQKLLRTSAIACARQEHQTFRNLLARTLKIAGIVDNRNQIDYWVPLVERASQFEQRDAVTYLQSHTASRLCYNYHNSASFFDAEKYGALGLQYLSRINDDRIRLDILQRLQVILYKYRALHELSFGLARRSSRHADQIGYHLRANGIIYNYATALSLSGQNYLALESFRNAVDRANDYHEITPMSWYKRNALLGMARAYWQLGQYKNAIATCEEVNRLEPTLQEQIFLHHVRGLINQSLGDPDAFETEYRIAFSLADSINDLNSKIRMLNDFGFRQYELTQFDRALRYYDQALELLAKANPEAIEIKVILLINKAKALVANDQAQAIDKIIREAIRLNTLTNLPWRRADLLGTMGELNLEIKNYDLAMDNFAEASSICEDNGLLRLGLEIDIGLGKSMLRLNRDSDARRVVLSALSTAKQTDNMERTIDALAVLARIENRSDNQDKAIEISNQMINQIVRLDNRFTNTENSIAFWQRVYSYLKEAILYEIYRQREDVALAKLYQAKAFSLRTLYRSQYGDLNANTNRSDHLNPDTLKRRLEGQSLVIEYLVTKDTLYAFTLDRTGLRLFRNAIDYEDLKNDVNAYRDLIDHSPIVLRQYNPKVFNEHFKATIDLGHKLFQALLRFSDLYSQIQNHELIYIVPDEFLHEVPFSTLVVDTSDTVAFLVENTALINLPSSSYLLSNQRSPDKHDLRDMRALVCVDRRISKTRELVNCVKQRFPFTEELESNKASFGKDDLIEALNQGHEIYVFSGHGFANTVEPGLSSIEITVRNPVTFASDTFQVYLEDIRKIDWSNAEMVMLIGCETASGRLYRGTGILGLQLGFLSSGANGVLGTLWKIPTGRTIEQTNDFLRVWAQTQNPARALKEMQLNSIRELRNHSYYKNPHPFLWGSYQLNTLPN